MKLICTFILFTAFSIQAHEAKKRAVIRDANFEAKIADVVLTDLISDESFEGKYFKIVDGKSNQAINFADSEDLQLKAATVYYHLTKARNFFVQKVKSSYVQEFAPITIRLNLTNVFNELGHFANDKLEPQYNNALSIPAGIGYEPRHIKPWGMEIWFRPSKEININDFKTGVEINGIKSALTPFRNQVHMTSLQNFLSLLIQSKTITSSVDPSSLIRMAGTSLLIEMIFQTSDFTADFFSRKIYKLDSAFVPEIIYHEFSHLALSNHLELTHSSPVNEGLADFFAGKIAQSKKLATNIKEYNLFDGKLVRKKQQYRLEFERGDFANADFVFGLLWNVGIKVGGEIENQFIYQMTQNLTTSSSIKDGLINSALKTCKTLCKNPSNDRLGLYKLFNSKNL